MLTVDVLKLNDKLSNLSDEQLAAVEEMSKNDENAVIGARIGALHGQYDADVYEATGVVKNSGEKSYDYVKRVLAEYKSEADKLSEGIKKLKAENEEIRNAPVEDSDKRLRDAQTRIGQLQDELKARADESAAREKAFGEQVKSIKVDYAFNAAASGLKFKKDITEPIRKTLLEAAKKEVLSRGVPDFINDGYGRETLVLRDGNGNILNNPGNNLNPYTVEELIKETSLKDVLDTSRTVTGAGTKGGAVPGNTGGMAFTGYSNQVEADRAIEKYLLAEGLTRDSREFAEKFWRIREDSMVNTLPIR